MFCFVLVCCWCWCRIVVWLFCSYVLVELIVVGVLLVCLFVVSLCGLVSCVVVLFDCCFVVE